MIQRPVLVKVKKSRNNSMEKQIIKATQELEKELHKQAGVIVGATILALHRNNGYGQKRIKDVIDLIINVFDKEVGTDERMTALRLCDEELGIELQNGNGQSYKDIHYLSGTSDLKRDQMTDAQFLYLRKQEMKWIAPQIFAGIMVAMHRKHGWSSVRLQRLMEQVDDIRNYYNGDPIAIRQAVYDEMQIIYFGDIAENGPL